MLHRISAIPEVESVALRVTVTEDKYQPFDPIVPVEVLLVKGPSVSTHVKVSLADGGDGSSRLPATSTAIVRNWYMPSAEATYVVGLDVEIPYTAQAANGAFTQISVQYTPLVASLAL